MSHYLQGETLIEAYWKSVAMPGQGIFIGEPLAKPFAGMRLAFDAGTLTIDTQSLAVGTYAIWGANTGIGPYQVVLTNVRFALGVREVKIPNANKQYYRFIPTMYSPSTSN